MKNISITDANSYKYALRTATLIRDNHKLNTNNRWIELVAKYFVLKIELTLDWEGWAILLQNTHHGRATTNGTSLNSIIVESEVLRYLKCHTNWPNKSNRLFQFILSTLHPRQN